MPRETRPCWAGPEVRPADAARQAGEQGAHWVVNRRGHSPFAQSPAPSLQSRRLLAVLCLCAACYGASPAAGEQRNPFEQVIAFAQERCVKLYGGGIAREHGYATGLLVSPDGLILTAQGIYLTSEELRVVLPDGTLTKAAVLRRSEPLQAALLKVEAATPKFFQLEAQPSARQGDWVLALGNPFKVAEGDEPLSVTLGIISLRVALDLKKKTQEIPYEGDVYLLDAITSNPGAPGGALLSLDGRLCGMIGRVVESADTNTRLNYAVPSDLLHAFVAGTETPKAAAAENKGTPFLGVRLFLLSGKRAPAYLASVAPDSPAAKAGLAADDLILAVNGKPVSSCKEYQDAENELVPRQKCILTVKRKNDIRQFTLDIVEKTGSEKE